MSEPPPARHRAARPPLDGPPPVRSRSSAPEPGGSGGGDTYFMLDPGVGGPGRPGRDPAGDQRPPRSNDTRLIVGGLVLVFVLGAILAISGGGNRVASTPTRRQGGAAGAAGTTIAVHAPTTVTIAPSPSPPVSSPTSMAVTPPVTPSGSVTVAEALPLLAMLRVAVPTPEVMASYERELFGDGWAYDGATGCSTRERVLIEESLDPPAMGPRCAPLSGRWYSDYDGRTYTTPAEIQIDHLVPLADAWRSGAASWTSQRRLEYANDLVSADTLRAVSGHTNQSKGDQSPDEWMPPYAPTSCPYAAEWVGVKARWDLSVTPDEQATLHRVLDGCR